MRKGNCSFLIVIVVLLLANSSLIFPCTTFVLKNSRSLLFGRNLDWYIGTGLLIVNKENIEKTALIDSSENPVKWISKYGSITFNQVGRDLPYGGMNEMGLVVEHMSLPKTKYPGKDNRPAIQACQWIQYQLDNCATIEEIIETDKFLRIVDKISLFHFLICDRFGNVAVIEFLDGKMSVKTGKDLPLTVLANSIYGESLTTFTTKANTSNDRSLYNFCTAGNMIQNYSGNDTTDDIAYSFNILKSVAQGPSTKWSIVYDIKNMKIYFKVFETPTLVKDQIIFLKEKEIVKTKVIDLSQIDFSCSSPSLLIDLESDNTGLINNLLEEYSTEINKKYILKAFDYFERLGVPIQVSDEDLNYLAKYPESFNCGQQ
jgi:penicillin V acylase-like amidase (Ntn superfamily)